MGGYITAGCSSCGRAGLYPQSLHVTDERKKNGDAKYICCRCAGCGSGPPNHHPCGRGYNLVHIIR